MRRPARVDQTDIQQIAQVRTVLVSKRRQFNADQGGQRQNTKTVGYFRFGDIGVGQRLMRTDFFTGEDNMNGIPRFRLGAVEKKVHPRAVAIDKVGFFQSFFHRFQVGAADEDVHIARIARGGFIDARHPSRNRVPAGHSVSDAGPLQGRRRPQ